LISIDWIKNYFGRKLRNDLKIHTVYFEYLKVMSLLIIKNGKVEIRKENSTLIRTFGNGDAVSAKPGESVRF